MAFRRNKSRYKVFTDSDEITRSVHKRVAEKRVGGKIYKGYVCHHKDGNIENNKPSNIAVLKERFHKKIHSEKQRSSLH